MILIKASKEILKRSLKNYQWLGTSNFVTLSSSFKAGIYTTGYLVGWLALKSPSECSIYNTDLMINIKLQIFKCKM